LPTFDGTGVVVRALQESGSTGWFTVPVDGGASRPNALNLGRLLPDDSLELAGSGAAAHGPQGWYLVGNRGPTNPGRMTFLRLAGGLPPFPIIVADAGGYGLSLSPNGRSLLYTKFVSSGADLMLVENF